MNNINKVFHGKAFLPAMILLLFACVLLMNVFCVPSHDELSYAYKGQTTPLVGECERIDSIGDIVRQEAYEYVHAMGGGRIFIHSLVAAFSGFRLYHVFDLMNSLVWMLLIVLIMKEGGVRLTARRFIITFGIVFVFWWHAENSCMNAAFAINYLWMACVTILIMQLWRRIGTWLLIPVAFFFGWGQEAFSLPMFGTLSAAAFLQTVRQRRYSLSAKQTVFLLIMLIGALGLVLSPGIRNRAEGNMQFSIGAFVMSLAKWGADLVLAVWPIVLLVCIVWILIRIRHSFIERIYADLEWWLFFVISFMFNFALCGTGGYRLCSGWELAGIILCIRYRHFFRAISLRCFVVAALLMFFISTGIQVACGLDNMRMLRSYKENSQGITYRLPVPCPGYAAARGLYAPWHLSLFARELDRNVPPVFFTKKMYDDIYKNPAKFFAAAERIDEKSGLWVNHSMPYCLLGRAEEIAPEIARSSSKRYFENRAKSMRKSLLPGRLKRMFPLDEDLLDPNLDEFEFCAEDGKRYIVYCGGEYVPKKIMAE